MLEGGDPNAMLGVMKVSKANAASQQTLFIVSGSPCNPILGEVTQMLCWGNNSPWVNAALQQTIFIVSGSPSYPILGKVIQMICWGYYSLGG